MKNDRREWKYATVMLLFIGIDCALTSTEVVWTKFYFEGESAAAQCVSNETRFIRDDEMYAATCINTCSIDEKCMTLYFHPENHQCIGCERIHYVLPIMDTSKGFLQWSKRQFNIDCKDILKRNPSAASGVYEITTLKNSNTLNVYCDMETDGGGWTVFQNRFDGSVNFTKNFLAYEHGFGDTNGEFWLGLKHIQELTEIPSEIGYHLYGHDDAKLHETYRSFKLVEPKYRLSISREPALRTGFLELDIDFYLSNYNDNLFSTFDRDSDNGCVTKRGGGGWWYSSLECDNIINFNGLYGGWIKVGDDMSHLKPSWKKIRMMFRRIETSN